MTYLLATYWLPLLLALLIGAATGYFTFARAGAGGWRPQSWPGWLKLLGVVFIVGLVVALPGWLPGAAGLWLETALLLVAAFIVGCLLGSWLASVLRAAAAQESRTPAQAVPAAAVVAPVSEPAPASPEQEPALGEGRASGEGSHPGARPAGLATPTGKPDDLRRISGIGPKNEKLLHDLGIYHFHQIATWNDDNIQWVDSYLSFKGRIGREDWVGQANTFTGEADR